MMCPPTWTWADVSLNTSASEGSASHKITDAWVYVDDQLVGVWEVPSKIPALEAGEHTVKVVGRREAQRRERGSRAIPLL
jgi:hypothetical protein